MLHRLAAFLIVLFWLGMTGLLVQQQFYPGYSRFNGVPAGHVGRVMFQHEQVSDLIVYQGKTKAGFLRILPRTDHERGVRVLEFNGSLSLKLMEANPQYLSWLGLIEMQPDYTVQKFQLGLNAKEQNQQFDILSDKVAGIETCTVSTPGAPQSQFTFTMDSHGLTSVLERFGFEPEIFSQLQGASQQFPPPEFTAEQSSIMMNGEKVATYQLNVRVGGQTVVEAHFSQLGQLLRAESTLLGYTLVPYNTAP